MKFKEFMKKILNPSASDLKDLVNNRTDLDDPVVVREAVANEFLEWMLTNKDFRRRHEGVYNRFFNIDDYDRDYRVTVWHVPGKWFVSMREWL